MKIGYARVSTDDQQTLNQIEALRAAGCEVIYEETASGGSWDRQELQKALDQLGQGDTLVVWKLDRLSRSLSDLLFALERVSAQGAAFKSLTESIDTSTAAGRMVAQLLGAFAEFERNIIRERTVAGLKAAKKRGTLLGRRPKFNSTQREEMIRLIESGERSAADVARLWGVSPSTICRMLKRFGKPTS